MLIMLAGPLGDYFRIRRHCQFQSVTPIGEPNVGNEFLYHLVSHVAKAP